MRVQIENCHYTSGSQKLATRTHRITAYGGLSKAHPGVRILVSAAAVLVVSSIKDPSSSDAALLPYILSTFNIRPTDEDIDGCSDVFLHLSV